MPEATPRPTGRCCGRCRWCRKLGPLSGKCWRYPPKVPGPDAKAPWRYPIVDLKQPGCGEWAVPLGPR